MGEYPISFIHTALSAVWAEKGDKKKRESNENKSRFSNAQTPIIFEYEEEKTRRRYFALKIQELFRYISQ